MSPGACLVAARVSAPAASRRKTAPSSGASWWKARSRISSRSASSVIGAASVRWTSFRKRSRPASSPGSSPASGALNERRSPSGRSCSREAAPPRRPPARRPRPSRRTPPSAPPGGLHLDAALGEADHVADADRRRPRDRTVVQEASCCASPDPRGTSCLRAGRAARAAARGSGRPAPRRPSTSGRAPPPRRRARGGRARRRAAGRGGRWRSRAGAARAAGERLLASGLDREQAHEAGELEHAAHARPEAAQHQQRPAAASDAWPPAAARAGRRC